MECLYNAEVVIKISNVHIYKVFSGKWFKKINEVRMIQSFYNSILLKLMNNLILISFEHYT